MNLKLSSENPQFLGRSDVDTEQGHHIRLHVELENERMREWEWVYIVKQKIRDIFGTMKRCASYSEVYTHNSLNVVDTQGPKTIGKNAIFSP